MDFTQSTYFQANVVILSLLKQDPQYYSLFCSKGPCVMYHIIMNIFSTRTCMETPLTYTTVHKKDRFLSLSSPLCC